MNLASGGPLATTANRWADLNRQHRARIVVCRCASAMIETEVQAARCRGEIGGDGSTWMRRPAARLSAQHTAQDERREAAASATRVQRTTIFPVCTEADRPATVSTPHRGPPGDVDQAAHAHGARRADERKRNWPPALSSTVRQTRLATANASVARNRKKRDAVVPVRSATA